MSVAILETISESWATVRPCCSVAEIADDLEEKEEVIAPIYEAALSMKPDYDVEKIYELLEKNKKLA